MVNDKLCHCHAFSYCWVSWGKFSEIKFWPSGLGTFETPELIRILNEGLSGLLSRGKPFSVSKSSQIIKMVTRDQLLAKAKVQTTPRYYRVWYYASHTPFGLLKRNTSYVSPTSDKSATESLKDMVCLRVRIGNKTQVLSDTRFPTAPLGKVSAS